MTSDLTHGCRFNDVSSINSARRRARLLVDHVSIILREFRCTFVRTFGGTWRRRPSCSCHKDGALYVGCGWIILRNFLRRLYWLRQARVIVRSLSADGALVQTLDSPSHVTWTAATHSCVASAILTRRLQSVKHAAINAAR